MERRRFGNTEVEVSAISLGCWPFGVDWWGQYSQERANELCKFSYDLGITFFDNGDAYGNGRAEELFGNWLKGSGLRRDQVEIGREVGYDFFSDPRGARFHRGREKDFSPAVFPRALGKSLQRLQNAHIDPY